MSFFQQEFLAPKYFSAQLLHGALAEEPSTARSGYWRLFFMRMQEEALAANVGEKDNVKEQEVVAPQTAATVKRRKNAPARTTVAVEHYPEVRFKRKPIYSQPEEIQPELAGQLRVWSTQMDTWLLASSPALVAQRAEHNEQQDAAANDADYRLRILLLAA